MTAANPVAEALDRVAASGTVGDEATLALVLAALARPEKAVQRLAADLVCRVDDDLRAAAIARLEAMRASTDRDGRWGAAYALARLHGADTATLAVLLETLAERDGDRRWAAADLLAACARADPGRVVPALLATATDPDPERRKMAFYALRAAAPAEHGVQAAALDGLADPVLAVRFAALAAVVRLEPVPAAACGLVLRLAQDDPDDGLRRAALCALGDVGGGVSAAEDAIAAAEASDDPLARRAALIARRRLATRARGSA